MSCNYYNGKCVFLNGKGDGCIACPIRRAHNKGVRDAKKALERDSRVDEGMRKEENDNE